MIVLDTHIWVWWVHGSPDLPAPLRVRLEAAPPGRLAASAISCWEVGKLVEKGRLELPCPVREWLEQSLGPSGVALLPITPAVAADSTGLPGDFHRDPADQMIVATARVHGWEVMTVDRKILDYPHVRTVAG